MNEPAPIEPSAAPKPKRSRRVNIIFWASVAAAILLLAAIAIPNFVKARTTACKNACVANLKQLDGGVQQWALEQKKQATDKPDLTGVKSYMKGGQLPQCPSGGTYILPDTISGEPRCSKGGSIEEQGMSGHR